MQKIVLVAGLVALGGCVTTSDITPIGKDSYMVGTTAMGGMLSHMEVKAASLKKASAFCQSMGKTMVINNMGSSGVRGWTPLESEVTFLCVDDGDPANQRPNLQKVPDTVVEIRK